MNQLEVLLQAHKFEFYRGDSFQVYVKSPADALLLVLQARTAAMKISIASSMPVADIRAGIGIGLVKLPVRSLPTSTDEAFVLSGRIFDGMKNNERLLITSNEKNGVVNIGLKVVAHFVDYIFHRLTAKQSAVVFELLMNRTQVETARRLKKSQATVNKHSQSAGWPDLEKLVMNYRYLTESIAI